MHSQEPSIAKDCEGCQGGAERLRQRGLREQEAVPGLNSWTNPVARDEPTVGGWCCNWDGQTLYFKLQEKRGKVSRDCILQTKSVHLVFHSLSVKPSSAVGENSQDLLLLAGSLFLYSSDPGIYSLPMQFDIIKVIIPIGWVLTIKNCRGQGSCLPLVADRTLTSGGGVLPACVPGTETESVCCPAAIVSPRWAECGQIIGSASCLQTVATHQEENCGCQGEVHASHTDLFLPSPPLPPLPVWTRGSSWAGNAA